LTLPTTRRNYCSQMSYQ